jgi:hypothetical protein
MGGEQVRMGVYGDGGGRGLGLKEGGETLRVLTARGFERGEAFVKVGDDIWGSSSGGGG